MKIIQSFWTGNIEHISDNNFGWVSSKYNLLSWILSANQLKKYYDNVELYTDELGAEILIEKLQLPYSKVHIVLNDLDSYHNKLWAISKIKTYSFQKDPFLHVDGDIYIWDTFPKKLLEANLITQNLEQVTDYYGSMWNDIKDHLLYIPKELNSFNTAKIGFACNMGIVGGIDIEFYKIYTSKAIEFVDKNRDVWDKISKNNFNIFFEQLLYYELAKKYNKKVDFLFDEIPDDNKYIGFGDFDKVPKERTYLHLLGNYKKDALCYKTMENYVLRFYPEYYKLLTNIFQEPSFFDNFNYNFSKTENQTLITDFTSTIQINKTLDKRYFLSRDLASIGLANSINELLTKKENFLIYKLSCNKLSIFNGFKEIYVKERIGDDYIILIDEIDELILTKLKKPLKYNMLIQKLKSYLEEDVKSKNLEVFINLINERIRFFVSRKVLSIVKLC